MQVKNRGPPRASPTELDGSTDTSGHTLHGTAASRTLPTTYRTHGRMQRPTVAPESAWTGRRRAHAARPRPSQRRPRSTSRGSACAARGVGLDRALDHCQSRRTSRTRAAQRGRERSHRIDRQHRARKRERARSERGEERCACGGSTLGMVGKVRRGLTGSRCAFEKITSLTTKMSVISATPT